MTAARGDTKPCIYTGCSGTMQFDRGVKVEDALRWACSESPKHLQRPADTRKAERATAAVRAGAGWDDDGGGGKPSA